MSKTTDEKRRSKDGQLIQCYLRAPAGSDQWHEYEAEIVRRVREYGSVMGSGRIITWNYAEGHLRVRFIDRNADKMPPRQGKTAYRVPEFAAAFRVGTCVIDFVEEEPCESV